MRNSNVQTAVNVATNTGDIIYLKYGTYTNASQIVISNVPGVTLSGGYEGSGSPGPVTTTNSILTRNTSTSNRIVYGVTSTVTLERVTVSGGYLANADKGAGLYLQSSDTTIQDCLIQNNRTDKEVAYGGGIYAINGSLHLIGTTLYSNRVERSGAENGAVQYGGGLYCNNVTVVASNCTFDANFAYCTGHWSTGGYGGATYLNAGSAQFMDCLFTNNYSSGDLTGMGGAIYANSLVSLRMEGCTFIKNYTYATGGGVMYLAGNNMNTRISNCQIMENRCQSQPTARGELYFESGTTTVVNCMIRGNASQAVYIAGGYVAMTNCLLAASIGDEAYASGGTARFVNVTMADNLGWGLRQTGGNVTALIFSDSMALSLERIPDIAKKQVCIMVLILAPSPRSFASLTASMT